MKYTIQRRLAAYVLGCAKKRVRFDPERLSEIKESITKADIKNLVANNAITAIPKHGVSRGRAKKNKRQKTKGKRRGQGSRKGKKSARSEGKSVWIQRVRLQRSFIKMLRERKILSQEIYRQIYPKIKGGFFRSKKHLNLYFHEHNLLN